MFLSCIGKINNIHQMPKILQIEIFPSIYTYMMDSNHKVFTSLSCHSFAPKKPLSSFSIMKVFALKPNSAKIHDTKTKL